MVRSKTKNYIPMKKIIFTVIAGAVICAAAFTGYSAHKRMTMRPQEILIAKNIEALASGEEWFDRDPDDSGGNRWLHTETTFTTVKCRCGIFDTTQTTMVITCSPGGPNPCMEGTYNHIPDCNHLYYAR